MGVGGQRHAPAALPPGMTRYPLYRRLGRPQGRSGRVLKISPPPGFDLEPRTWKLVASRYTDHRLSSIPTTLSRPTYKAGKVKVKFTLEQAMKAQRGSTGIALLFL
jgi:hypothetical protein